MEIRYTKDGAELSPEYKEAKEKIEELMNKEHSADYDAMFLQHTSELKDIAAATTPFDYSYGLDFLVQHLRFMRDYYKLGENVWGMEKKDEDPKRYKNIPTRLETLEKALYYYDKWINLEDEYIKVVDHPETFKEHDNGDGTFTIDNLGFHCEYKYGSMKRTYKKLHKAQEKYKKLFFKTLACYCESWWD